MKLELNKLCKRKHCNRHVRCFHSNGTGFSLVQHVCEVYMKKNVIMNEERFHCQ